MKRPLKHYLSAILLIFAFAHVTYAQIYQPGYIIENDGHRTECLINNVDWSHNPTRIQVKLTSADNAVYKTINDIREFSITGYSTFVRQTVKIDESSEEISKMDASRNPVWVTKTLFLRMIVKGTYSLFEYSSQEYDRFYYRLSDTTLIPLVYKKYRVEGRVGTNIEYQQQLYLGVKCDARANSTTDVARVRYGRSDLVKFFKEINKCLGDSTPAVSPEEKRRPVFAIKPTIGFTDSRLDIRLQTQPYDKLPDAVTFRPSIEAEFFLPVNLNRWSLLIEPYLQSYSAVNQKGAAKFKVLQTSVGFRYYAFPDKDVKLFFNGVWVLPFNYWFERDIRYSGLNFNVDNSGTGGAGLGMQVLGVSAELRYFIPVDLIKTNSGFLHSQYHAIAFVVGYKLFTARK